MPLKLMYITNQIKIARIAEDAGVDRIFVDMEIIGKGARQGGMDTVQSHHTVADIAKIRNAIQKAELMVRCNPIHAATGEFLSSKDEIDAIVSAGADIIMLPYFKTVDEVRTFIQLVDGRAKVFPLVETPEAVAVIDEILALPGINEVYVGLNDLSLGYKKKFMFELLSDGTVEMLCKKFREKGIPYGFGGIAALGKGMLPAEYVIREHYRLGSTCSILSRSFCNTEQMEDVDQIRTVFNDGLRDIRNLELECKEQNAQYFEQNRIELCQRVARIVSQLDHY